MREWVKMNMSRWIGSLNPSYKHWMSTKKIYKVWQNIIRRIFSKNNNRYHRYWDRWIIVCDKWKKFENFYKDMWELYKEWLSIERIDNNKWYYKENCKWATAKQQANNRCTNIYIKIDGRTQTLTEWCEELNLPYTKIIQRIRILKWDAKKALELI